MGSNCWNANLLNILEKKVQLHSHVSAATANGDRFLGLLAPVINAVALCSRRDAVVLDTGDDENRGRLRLKVKGRGVVHIDGVKV